MAHYICSSCGYGSYSWYGRCPSCNQWNTLKEQIQEGKKYSFKVQKANILPFNKLSIATAVRIKTSIFEFDRVLGGGFVEGAVILLAGEPGVGKSTLILSCIKNIDTLYVSGEESGLQIRHRADRLRVDLRRFYYTDANQVDSVIETFTQSKDIKNKVKIIIIDSLQTMYSQSQSSLGSISQMRESLSKLIDFSKKNNIILIVIGHVTKEGEIAGPKTIEHLVDCVLYLEGERESQYRILRSHKNRFGSTDEVGVFEMSRHGLKQVNDPLSLLDSKKTDTVGKAIIGSSEGSRVLFYEIQSLVVDTYLSIPKRIAAGVDYNRLQLLIAVIKKYIKLPLDRFDIYVSVTGGLSVKSPSADVGIISCIISSVKNIKISQSMLYIGEVGLLGEIRHVAGYNKIVKEGERCGFTNPSALKNSKTIQDLYSFLSSSVPR